MSDPFLHSDAAYVFGALDPDEREAFEAHLRTCPACHARVADARATVALLGPAGVDLPVDVEDEHPPDTLLPGLLRRARREQRRRRAVTATIGAVAAACLAALVVAIWPGSDASSPAPRPQALSAITPPSFVSATAALRARSWGTEIDVRCKYAHGGDTGTARTYGLRVVDQANQVHAAGTWTQSGEQTVVFTGGTEVRRERIAKVQVTRADGTPILQLTL